MSKITKGREEKEKKIRKKYEEEAIRFLDGIVVKYFVEHRTRDSDKFRPPIRNKEFLAVLKKVERRLEYNVYIQKIPFSAYLRISLYPNERSDLM